MKNKKTAYFLVPVVLFVWGMIGWKVYAAMSHEKLKNVAEKKEESASSAEIIPDTFELIANYRDPFLDKIVIKENPKPVMKTTQPVIAKEKNPPAPELHWPDISYHGLVMRNNNEKKLGFLGVNGSSCFVQEGQEVSGVKIGKLMKDSVEIFLGKARRVVRK